MGETSRAMVENRTFGDRLAYIILTIGVLHRRFPVYLTFVASTWDATTIINGQMPLYPGPHFLENYYRTLFVGTSGTTREPVLNMMFNSLIMALVHRFRKDRHLDPLGLRHRLLPFPLAA